MVKRVRADDLRIGSGRTARFEGEAYGSGVSFFFVHNEPGQGPDTHRHPYSETWMVLDGEVVFTVDDVDEPVARTGDIAVVPPATWHRFRAVGSGTLRMMCIHASPAIIQEFRDEVEA